MSHGQHPPALSYTLSSSPSLSAFTSQSPSQFLAANPPIQHLIAGALVTNPQGRILLLRRAPHDSWPLQWEVPGGCVDHDDRTFVGAAVRELWEESKLRPRHVKCVVGLADPDDGDDAAAAQNADALETELKTMGDVVVFHVEGEGYWGKLTVWVDVQDWEDVRICEEEHVEHAWVTEREARDRRFEDGRVLDFVSEGVRRTVLEGFRLWREENQGSQGG
ncbi:hypothetical protein ACJ41O_000509 [Fusarium nematophilum]